MGDDNVYTLDIAQDQILYKPKSGKTSQVFHTPQVVATAGHLEVGFYNPLTLENITVVGNGGKIWLSSNGGVDWAAETSGDIDYSTTTYHWKVRARADVRGGGEFVHGDGRPAVHCR